MRDYVKKWVKAAAVRAIKTMAQTAAATIGSSVILADVDWKVTISAAVLASILSLLTSAAGLPEIEMEDQPAERKEMR